MDKMTITKLKIFCNHGVYESEKENGQNFYVDLVAYLDTYGASVCDDLDLSVNYADLCHSIKWFMTDNRFNMIETVANRLADFIFEKYQLIRGLDLTINKPEAPIGLPFENVSISISRKWQKAYVAYGSNQGDSIKLIDAAIDKISNNKAIRVIKNSSIIVTEPYGGVEQDDFYNGCLEIETYLEADKLLEFLAGLEIEAGRVREVHWGPRTLDLDLILYADDIINTEKLTVPHPDMHNRTFVLEPLCEIAPYAYNPRLQKTAAMLLAELKAKEELPEI